MNERESLCHCGHAPDFCHVRNAERWCGAGASGKHFCWVEDDPDDGEKGHFRPCPASSCNAALLFEIACGQAEELQKRRNCLVEARRDLEAISHASAEDGGLWMRSVAAARLPFLDGAIEETDRALAAAEGLLRDSE